MEPKFAIDDLRFLQNIHTTARQLPVITKIVTFLDDKQLHKRVLEKLLVAWSINQEEVNESYKRGKGKITNDNKKTNALRHYLDASTTLGLTIKYNDLFKNTKISRVFLSLYHNEDDSYKKKLSEKAFYIFQLLRQDADAIIQCLEQLKDKSNKIQKHLQEEFRNSFNERLILKTNHAQGKAKFKISEKYRTINFIWKKPEKYAEHIIAPRYEWLSNLELVRISRQDRKTSYSCSHTGELFLDNLPSFAENSRLIDISDEWINNSFFSFLSKVFEMENTKAFEDLPQIDQEKELGVSLNGALKINQSSMAFKMPLSETLFYICTHLLLNKKIILNFSTLKETMKNDFSFEGNHFLIRDTGRPSESYITVTKR